MDFIISFTKKKKSKQNNMEPADDKSNMFGISHAPRVLRISLKDNPNNYTHEKTSFDCTNS